MSQETEQVAFPSPRDEQQQPQIEDIADQVPTEKMMLPQTAFRETNVQHFQNMQAPVYAVGAPQVIATPYMTDQPQMMTQSAGPFFEVTSPVHWSPQQYITPMTDPNAAFSPHMGQLPEGALLSPKPDSLSNIAEKLQAYMTRNATDPAVPQHAQPVNVLFSPNTSASGIFSPPLGILTPLLSSPNLIVQQGGYVTTQLPQAADRGTVLPPGAMPQSPEGTGLAFPSWFMPSDSFASGMFSPGSAWQTSPMQMYDNSMNNTHPHFTHHYMQAPAKPEPEPPAPEVPVVDPASDSEDRSFQDGQFWSVQGQQEVACLSRLQVLARSVMDYTLRSLTRIEETNPEIKAAEVLYMAQLMLQSAFPALACEMPAFLPNNPRHSTMMLAHPDEFKNPSSFLKVYGDPLCYRASSLLPKKGRSGNWECHKCQNVNFPRRFRCNKCGVSRDGEGDRIVAEYTHQVFNRKLPQLRSVQAVPQFNPSPNNDGPPAEEESPTNVESSGAQTAPARSSNLPAAVGTGRPAASETSRYVPPTAPGNKKVDETGHRKNGGGRKDKDKEPRIVKEPRPEPREGENYHNNKQNRPL